MSENKQNQSGSQGKKPISTLLIAVIVIVIVVIGAVGYVAYQHYYVPSKPVAKVTTKTVTISPPNPNTLVDLGSMGQIYSPDALDPATGFYVVDEPFFTAVYQGLVTFNGSSLTQLV
ncbi:hypothetical protein PRZ02_07040, partial [Thermoproteati archaeon 3817-70]